VSVPGEEVTTQYWLWEEPITRLPPKSLGMPAILEVRAWSCGECRVSTPQNIFVHWESINAAWPDGLQPEELIPGPEEFARLRAAGAVQPLCSGGAPDRHQDRPGV
jgi:hypothetical protein